ncbi:hypothetical protein HPB50_017961 [Hyalomma asiaticum]|uniref:Uncharacterized protein n=1 Tax=Hyalomma asiaticum TaxID=266040 RepID=A0ACB7T8B9_HYAAI|nr:hypothetical protein HPB50_017961 [Hyalomma asiaticum]
MCHRSALTAAEVFLSTVGDVPFRVHSEVAVTSALEARGLRLVALKSNNLSTLQLFRKSATAVDLAKQEVVRVSSRHVRYAVLLDTICIFNGFQGPLENWLQNRTQGKRKRRRACMRVRRGRTGVADFSPDNESYKQLLERDLVMNVYRDGQWGSYRHRSVKWRGVVVKETSYAFLSLRTLGDLSSLQWYESPLNYAPPSGKSGMSSAVCDVYYAPLNFHDILLATGKVQVEPPHGVCMLFFK